MDQYEVWCTGKPLTPRLIFHATNAALEIVKKYPDLDPSETYPKYNILEEGMGKKIKNHIRELGKIPYKSNEDPLTGIM